MTEETHPTDAPFGDPELATIDRALRQLAATAPRDAALPRHLAEVRRRAEGDAPGAGSGRAATGAGRHRSATVLGLAAAVLALAVIGLSVRWITRPQPVSAQAVLQRMRAALADPAASTITGVHFTETITYPPAAGSSPPPGSMSGFTPASGDQELWFASPRRVHTQGTTVGADGTVRRSATVSDGADIWSVTIDATATHVLVNTVAGDEGGWDFTDFFGGPVASLSQLLGQAGSAGCRSVALRAPATIAGRSAYVVEIGANTCAPHPTIAPSSTGIFDTFDGRQVLWIDRETFFPLKTQQYGADGDTGLGYTVTSIEYNPTLPANLFTYTPPPGAAVTDRRILRPTGTPSTPPERRERSSRGIAGRSGAGLSET